MFDVAKVDVEALRNPPEPFKFVIPDYQDFEFCKKMVRFEKHLLERYLWTSDEHRTPEYVHYSVTAMFNPQAYSMFYEIGDWQGLIGFVGMLPDFKCGMIFKIWDKNAWGKQLVRTARKMMNLYMKEFRLKRISTQTADPKIVRMAKMAGFKEEGERPLDFMWKGSFFPTYVLGYREEK